MRTVNNQFCRNANISKLKCAYVNLNTNTQKLTALSGNISKLNFANENWNAITEKYFFLRTRIYQN